MKADENPGDLMVQQTSVKKRFPRIFPVFRARYAGNIAAVLSAVFVLTVLSLLISEFDTGSRRKVYATDSSQGTAQFQTGLSGVVAGVSGMEAYSDRTRLVNAGYSNEDTLAGAGGIDRRILYRTKMQRGTKSAGALGYYAQQTVLKNQMASDEYQTLLQIVEAEATGGDVTSKMMVAGVVLNRVRDSHFPDTIQEVVWQKDQFQPTSDGRIYSCTVTDSTTEAVDRVLAGEDVSQGALFFFARESAEAVNTAWFDSSLTKLFEYGGHEYYTFQNYAG